MFFGRLFNGSDLSLKDSCLLFTGYMFRFELSKKAVKELIKLINLMLPSDNKFPKSYEKILSYLNV